MINHFNRDKTSSSKKLCCRSNEYRLTQIPSEFSANSPKNNSPELRGSIRRKLDLLTTSSEELLILFFVSAAFITNLHVIYAVFVEVQHRRMISWLLAGLFNLQRPYRFFSCAFATCASVFACYISLHKTDKSSLINVKMF